MYSGDSDDEVGYACVGAGSIGNLYTSYQFSYEVKTALKKQSLKKWNLKKIFSVVLFV